MINFDNRSIFWYFASFLQYTNFLPAIKLSCHNRSFNDFLSKLNVWLPLVTAQLPQNIVDVTASV